MPNTILDKGERIMEGLLTNQYQNSPNLKAYMMCFISELDLLFEQISRVHTGRFLEHAVGRQLDIIGIILQQNRALSLNKANFGFKFAPGTPLGMADEKAPAFGGVFKDEHSGDSDLVPLDDKTYRRMLQAKALVLNGETPSNELTYLIVSVLLGRVPSVFELRESSTTLPIAVINGKFDKDIAGWLPSPVGAAVEATWLASKIKVTAKGEHAYYEQKIPQVRYSPGDSYKFKITYNNQASSKCHIMVGTRSNPSAFYDSKDLTGSGDIVASLTLKTEETIYVYIGSVEKDTWSTFDSISLENSNTLPDRTVELILSTKDVAVYDIQLISYMSKYFVPTGINFNIRPVVIT